MSQIEVAAAARNNAAWCDAVCSAHGSPGEFCDSYWLSRAPTPPYYPNLVTLDPACGPAMAAIQELEQARPFASFAVKDSFGVLPLERADFRLLFSADWLLRPAVLGRPHRRSPAGRWLRVQSDSALAAWEAAWGESLGQPRVFPPALLRRTEIAILAGLDDGGAVTAGVVANRSQNAVGLSNLFAHESERGSLLAECLDVAMDAFPDLPVVGYGVGRDVAESKALGFRSLGSLRVWLKQV
jgi:hypothetical protein